MSQVLNQIVPLDIANIILEYTGYHKCRNGQYMPQIARSSKIYRTVRRLFNRTISHKTANNGFVVLKVSPTTKYIVFDSYKSALCRL